MSEPSTGNVWSEGDSARYSQLSQIAVPDREMQTETLLTLFPFTTADTFRVVELASGEGLLAQAILERFPRASMLALDGSELMRQQTAERLRSFGERAKVGAFDMLAEEWYDQLAGVDVVVSSLCIHHLDGAQKQHLFNAISARLSPRGALLIADLVAPQRPEGWTLFANQWDASARERSERLTGGADAFAFFQQTEWNYYRYPDPFDKPSPLFDQLLWLKAAGFAVVDCFWLQAGHSIYGGYKLASQEGQ
jgi:phospholipid N-methyltransferase